MLSTMLSWLLYLYVKGGVVYGVGGGEKENNFFCNEGYKMGSGSIDSVIKWLYM